MILSTKTKETVWLGVFCVLERVCGTGGPAGRDRVSILWVCHLPPKVVDIFCWHPQYRSSVQMQQARKAS